jgi:cyclopropane-fatty-acyl-phospholipid synthase
MSDALRFAKAALATPLATWRPFARRRHSGASPGARDVVNAMLEAAGIELGGSGARAVQVLDDRVFDVALTRGFTGLRDAYVDGWWDADRLDVVTDLMLSSSPGIPSAHWTTLALGYLDAAIRNPQSLASNAKARRHYDLGNDLYQAMLDRRLVYSCGYWRNARTLDDAQEAKLDLVCRKLHLVPGQRVLDIGCGWGSLAKFAAERYGVTVVGITISAEQAKFAAVSCAGLPIEIRLQDYRSLGRQYETFDRIVSLGMFEHVGVQNYRRYMQFARAKLIPDGLFMLHTIGNNISRSYYDSWMAANIFPNAWFDNFDAHWPALRSRYGDRFYRIWKCYLLTCAGSFRARRNRVWQIIFSPRGLHGGYAVAR